MNFEELLLQLKVPPVSYDLANVRARRHEQLTLITTFGFPVTSLRLLQKLRKGVSSEYMRKVPHETLNDIYAAKYVVMEMRALELRIAAKVGPAL